MPYQNLHVYLFLEKIPTYTIIRGKAKIADYGLTNDFTNTYTLSLYD